MKLALAAGIVTALILLGIGKLYVDDAATVTQARVVEAYFKDYCRTHDNYPTHDTVEARFPHLFPGREWYYWPNDTHTTAAFQYPMTLPLPSAPGRSKFSEFFPVIYAYAVRHPCDGLLPRTPPAPKR